MGNNGNIPFSFRNIFQHGEIPLLKALVRNYYYMYIKVIKKYKSICNYGGQWLNVGDKGWASGSKGRSLTKLRKPKEGEKLEIVKKRFHLS